MRASSPGDAIRVGAAAGAVLVLLSAAAWRDVSGLALGIAAGTFLYIAIADLLPSLWRAPRGSGGLRHQAAAGLAVGLVLAALETLWS